ncbi:response regulator transcription factor [Gramella sp. KN1008]|uniref:response regulator transcription factor n=1 Tax=Gramella sp. KN1008 TaxID=2529298 RepID=UPI00103A642A|nr:helix-turn-helix transcriptional regulator [Gramella sp. KN1008]TBW27130.1 LuxR family transcriptional regulator [Gramella sp. KN1008]
MSKELEKITEYWKENYSSHVSEYRPFEISHDFKRFASMFALGNSYMYIVNLHDFGLEYISESVKSFVKKDIGDIELKDILQTVVSEEIENIHLKSQVINEFYTSFLQKDEVLDYKNIFFYRMKDPSGQVRTMLYQAIPLNVLENGAPEHVLCIQTDVSHLKVTATDTVSLIHMNGGKCYYNVEVTKGKFDPETCERATKDLSELFSEREIEIIKELANGLNAQDIARKLNLSPHTVMTHRKNILQKSGCSNTAQLVAKCITGGVIPLNLN